MKKIKLRNEQGSVSVEFALISILLFLIVFGILEFGILMFDKHILTNASREGARAGIVMRAQFDYNGTTINRVSDDEIEKEVEQYAQQFMVNFKGSSNLDITVSPDEASRGVPDGSVPPSFGTPLVVTVTYPFDFLFISSLGVKQIPLKAETRMRME